VPIHAVVRPSQPAPVVAPYPAAVMGLVADRNPQPATDPVPDFNQSFFGRRPSGLSEAVRVLWNEYVTSRRVTPGVTAEVGGVVSQAITVRMVPAWLADP